MKKVIIIFVMVCVCVSGLVFAKDYEHKLNLNKNSKTKGFAVSEVDLLSLKQGRGREIVVDDVLNMKSSLLNVPQRAKSQIEKFDEFTNIVGDGWFIRVWGDGTKVEMRNFNAYDEKKQELRRTNSKYVDSQISNNRLEEIGLKFIESNLRQFIPVRKNEKIVPFHSIYEIESEEDSKGDTKEEVVASIVVFSRIINGVDVVGTGSKISIMFANDETPVGFRFDWPEYEQSEKKQRVLSFPLIRERLSGKSRLISVMDNATLDRLECGYYDSGIDNRTVDFQLQSSCFAFYIGNAAGLEESYAASEVIPMGEIVEKDSTWQATLDVIETGDVCQESDVTSAVFF